MNFPGIREGSGREQGAHATGSGGETEGEEKPRRQAIIRDFQL